MATLSTREWTVRQMLEWTSNYFEEKHLDEPHLSARLLLAKVLGCSKVDLYLRFEDSVTADQRAAYRDLVHRASACEPIAYLIGSKEFYSLQFLVRKGTPIPRPETELLVQWVIRKVRSDHSFAGRKEIRLIELGTGTACVAISLARFMPGPCKIIATDICSETLRLAAENCVSHGVDDRIELLETSLFDAVDPASRFDFVVANLPYVTEEDYRAFIWPAKDTWRWRSGTIKLPRSGTCLSGMGMLKSSLRRIMVRSTG